ncbi:hypothetical protein QYE76_059178 [Lolium multiflorum]|uniref:F-box domain-containing protein n=1 Tax=Lolium multiflorum TaxID=4521 RepID=A0AAD8VG12_LOLMU|nr:hypothetical protein QYE76_059178 [Lolium multiflorum]
MSLMDKQSSQEHSIIENKGDAFRRLAKPNLAAMQLQLLPSDILRDVLSLLSLKEVVRMSILSREWRRLRICHPDLVFTKDTFGNITTGNTEQREEMTCAELMDFNAKKLEWLTRRFIKNVDNVLRPLWYTPTTTITTTTTLDKFAVRFGLWRKHRYHIDKWVSFSTCSRAKHIVLDFTSEDVGFGSQYDKYKYALPLSNLSGPNGSCVRSLYLGNIYLETPPSFCGITNLKELTLNTVSINGDDLECLLLSCALLEILSIEWCKSLSILRIRQELRHLQYLRVRFCDLELIELHASNLNKFEFDDSVKQIVLSECLKLSEATFVSNMSLLEFDEYGFDFTFAELPTGLPHLHKLFLLLNPDQVLRFSDSQSHFINLRHLNINLEIFFYPPDTSWAVGLVNLLELTPLLEELELHLSRDRYPSAIRTAMAMQGRVHLHLKSVYMSGFSEVLGLAELALYILENATRLKRMVVDPVSYTDPSNDDIYSVSKGGISEEDLDDINWKRAFAEKNLHREEFRHILTIL